MIRYLLFYDVERRSFADVMTKGSPSWKNRDKQAATNYLSSSSTRLSSTHRGSAPARKSCLLMNHLLASHHNAYKKRYHDEYRCLLLSEVWTFFFIPLRNHRHRLQIQNFIHTFSVVRQKKTVSSSSLVAEQNASFVVCSRFYRAMACRLSDVCSTHVLLLVQRSLRK